MGCDEHFYLEVRKDGRWLAYSQKARSKYYDPEFDDPNEELELPQFEEFTGGRNYNAYALIADVRNGMSLLGGGRAFIPISGPKGVPNDASPEYLEMVNRWDGDGHSHTWLTLQELLDYPWYRHSEIRGVVGLREFARWSAYDRDNKRSPSNWAGGVSGPGIEIIDMQQADELLEKRKEELGNQYWDWVHGRPPFEPENKYFDGKLYVSSVWYQPYTEAVGDLYTRGIPRMIQVRDELGLTNEDVRAVGFFDN
jgi:hypothetical protein